VTLQGYLEALVRATEESLGESLLGVYAAGSVALGAYEPGRSDVDVALVTSTALSSQQKRDLVERLRHESLPCPARGLELVAYRREVAAAGTPGPGFEVELNTGSGVAFRETFDPADRPVKDGSFWYGLDRSILHEHGLALSGPPAAEVFADLDEADLRRLMVEAMTWWIGREVEDSVDAVLGACRALVKLRHGTWVSKVAAGERLVADGGSDAVVQMALSARSGGRAPTLDAARAFQRRALTEVAG